MRIFIVHRWDGAPTCDWIPSVTEQLAKSGHEVHAISMPHPEAPTITDWVSYLAEQVGAPDAQTFFIGHSIGCQTVMRYAEHISTPVAGAIFVAGWFTLMNLEDEPAEKIAAPWLETPIDFAKVRANIPHITAILSTNDPFAPFNETKAAFENQLHAHIIPLANAGHITEDDGFTKLPDVITAFNAK